MALDMGFNVSGSDRGSGNPENRRIFDALVKSGLELYPQDGSFAKSGKKTDYLVYSTAIEEDIYLSAGRNLLQLPLFSQIS